MNTPGPTADVTADPIERRFPRSTARLAEIRRAVRSWCEAHAMPQAMVDDFELAVSELATNATQHGTGPDIAIELSATPTFFSVVVAADTRHADQIGDVGSWQIAPPEALSGRGLGIVAAVMDEVEFSGDDGRAVFRCRRRR